MDLDSKVGGDSLDDHILLVTDLAVGHGSAIDLDTGTATPGISLGIEGRTLADAHEHVRWDYLLSEEYALAAVGLLFEQLHPSQREHLVALWRSRGIEGI